MLNSSEHENCLANKYQITKHCNFLLNIAEHENFSANKYENANLSWHFHIYWQRKFHAQHLSWHFHIYWQRKFHAQLLSMKSFITSGPDQKDGLISCIEYKILFLLAWLVWHFLITNQAPRL